jgi:hypothetical protein
MDVNKKSQSYVWLFGDDKFLLKIYLFHHYTLVPVFLFVILLER